FCSWVPWLKLSRNTSTPASNSARSRSGLLLAGPRVATILALRVRRITRFCPRARSLKSGALVNEDGSEIIDIGQRRTSHDEIPGCSKKPVPVVFRQRVPDCDPAGGGARDRIR